MTAAVKLVEHSLLSSSLNIPEITPLIVTFTIFIADHFDHIKKVGGAGIIGFGGDYDGVTRCVLRMMWKFISSIRTLS